MTTTTRTTALTGALITAWLLTACSSDNEQPPAGSPSTSVAPQTDARELADWAATTFLAKESADICEVGTDSLAKRFASDGWCESDVTFKQTPITLDLVATCDASEKGGNTPPGTLYAYHVDPSIDVTGEGNTDGGIVVIVDEHDDTWLVSDLYVTDLDPADPVIGSCPHGGLQLLDESVSLG